MVIKGGGNGIPSYKQVVVERGKGPRGVSFKEPLTGTSGLGSEKNQEGNQEKMITWGKKPDKPRMVRKKQRTPVG
jgi:hypothetical protein